MAANGAVDLMPRCCGRERAKDRQKFADKSVEAGQADAAPGEEDEEKRQDGHSPRQARKLIDVARVIAVVNHADHEEQRPGAQAVVDHVHDRALMPLVLRAIMPSTQKPRCDTDCRRRAFSCPAAPRRPAHRR